MANQKKPGYDELRHKLDSEMLSASNLQTKPEQQGFFQRTFEGIHKASQSKQINHGEYIKLINRLAAYKNGAFNDYLDILAGAAQMGMLETVIQGEISQLEPDAARKRRDAITDLTGVKPIEPED